MKLEHFCSNLETVAIITQSVYIIQCTHKEDIQIVSSEDELEQIEKNGGLTQEQITERFWYKNAIRMGLLGENDL